MTKTRVYEVIYFIIGLAIGAASVVGFIVFAFNYDDNGSRIFAKGDQEVAALAAAVTLSILGLYVFIGYLTKNAFSILLGCGALFLGFVGFLVIISTFNV